MFGIFGLLFRGAREKLQERAAKNSLESKLGRKVSKAELYSLSSHLDAAQPTAPQMPLQQGMPRESSVPFGDAKAPMKTSTKLLIGGALVLVIGIVGVAAVAVLAVMSMSTSTYNKLNPFTPKPSPADFPAQIGKFKRSTDVEYLYSEFSPAHLKEYFYSNYNSAEAGDLKLYVYEYKTLADAQAGFEAQKKQMKSYQGYQFIDDSSSRLAAVWLKTGSTSVTWLDGMKMRYVSGMGQKAIYELEGLLRNKAPVEVVEVKTESSVPAANDGAVSVTQLLDDYKKDTAAADKKYKDKIVKVTGKAVVSEKDKKGNWMIAFMRPASTNPADGMVVCSFDKSKEASVSTVKKGDTVTLEGKVSMFLVFSAILENCSKL
jgi:hypothetical protein